MPRPRSAATRSCPSGRRGERQLDEEGRTDALGRLDPDGAAHPPDQLAADVEAETRAADGAGHVREAVELLEDPLLLGLRNADPFVAYGHAQAGPTRLEPHLDAARAW